MARNSENKFWSVEELAKRTKTPAPFLAKTFQTLVKARILNSTKGRGGGFSFARKADRIFLIDIVKPIDGTTLTHDCALGLPECNDNNPCPFHDQWKRIRIPLIEALSQESLTHVAKQAKELH